MRRSLVVLLFVGLLVSAIGCAAPRSVVREVARPVELPAPAPAWNGAASAVAGVESAADSAERMIVRTVELSMVVNDTEATLKAVNALVADAGGYVNDSRTWRETEQLRARVVVRIPADRLDATLEAFKKLAVRIERENISGRDVTEEYSDLNAQLTNLEATERELRELLSEVRQRTQKAEDILQVYQELTRIRGEIERVKGRMQYLSNQTALATVTLDLIPDVLARPVVEPGWRPLETLKNAGRALVNALKGLVDAAIWLVIFVTPLLLVLAVPVVLLALLIRWLARRRRRPQSGGPQGSVGL